MPQLSVMSDPLVSQSSGPKNNNKIDHPMRAVGEVFGRAVERWKGGEGGGWEQRTLTDLGRGIAA